MKYCVIFVVCFSITLTIRLHAIPSQTLENLTAYEKSNAIIDIECEEGAQARADVIEETWNSGNYEEAIGLLKNSPELDDEAIGIQWKEPVKMSSRWSVDVQVGSNDSIRVVDLDVDNSTGHLFAVIMHQEGTSHHWTANISTDTGKTWAETFTWGSITSDVDCAVLGDYFYVAYSVTTHTGRIRRFNTSDGSSDEVYGNIYVISEGVPLKDISLTSDADAPSSRYLIYLSIMENDSLRLYFNFDTLATSWIRDVNFYNLGISNADRGLDACCAVPNKVWTSYIGTDDSLYVVGGWSSWSHYKLYYSGTNSSYVTSISAYGDTVITVVPSYHSTLDEYWVVYRITYDGGTDWAWGPIFMDSTNQSFVNDVTARNGDGIGIVYVTVNNAEGFYTHRGYPSADFITPVSFADNVPRNNVKPSIERIADGVYGTLYVNWPGEMAWFDRSDWGSGIDEDVTDKNTISISSTAAIFSSKIDINYYLPATKNNGDMSLDIYDITGAHVKTLARGMPAGSHSVTWFGDSDGVLAPNGIYFAVLKSGDSKESLKITLIR
ncbi:hypothetical protein JW879_05510 [candidate division WOR-3 bacterium]|nr:hypothetical protein [candidate division WOR-3 bacterium]